MTYLSKIITAKKFQRYAPEAGFTLIELSIVLVIIGLIIGGILTGQSLIDAAAQRAQIAQIEKYNTAVRTFQGKYGYLPGDIPNPYATQFGFQTRGFGTYTLRGTGDGDGNLQGIYATDGASECGICENAGETIVFWSDLSAAGLIDGSFTTATISNPAGGFGANFTDIKDYVPAAKIGQANYVYAWSGGWNYAGNNKYGDSINYYGIAAITLFGPGVAVTSTPGMTVAQAYNIDKKVDDGFPMSGNVTALYANSGVIWAGSGQPSGTAPYTSSTPGGPTTCFDNNSSGSNAAQHYSTEINGGAAQNCALSFRFQ